MTLSGIDYALRHLDFEGVGVDLWVVEDPNSLLDGMTEADFGEEEKMPYWAALWPAAMGLAGYMRKQGLPKGCRVLELGCGLGLNGVLAAKMGAEVAVTDWYHEAVEVAALNAKLNSVEIRSFWMDWNYPHCEQGFDFVLGSDILYEDRNHQPVLRALGHLMAEHGKVWLSDPGRAHLGKFVELARKEGWNVERDVQESIVILVLRRN